MKSIKLKFTIKYLLTLLLILCIVYITYYFYNKNNYEHLSSNASTIKSKSNTRFEIMNKGPNPFRVEIYPLNYNRKINNRKANIFLNTSEQNKIRITQNITSGNIGYLFKITPYTNSLSTKISSIEIKPCLNKRVNNNISFKECETKLDLLTSNDISLIDMSGIPFIDEKNFKIEKIQNGLSTKFKISTNNITTPFYTGFYIK